MSHHREIVHTDSAPKALGPYSQANIAGNMVFVSGQLGMDPASGEFVDGGVAEQTDRALKNLQAIVEAASCRKTALWKSAVSLSRPECQAVKT